MLVVVFSACSHGLEYLRPSNPAVPGQSFSSWTQYNQTVRHCYILFVFIVCPVFCRLQSGLSISSALSPKYTKPGLPAEKKYKKNIAMTDCLVILYPACRQPVIVIILFVFMVSSVFFSSCSPGFVYLGPKSVLPHRDRTRRR